MRFLQLRRRGESFERVLLRRVVGYEGVPRRRLGPSQTRWLAQIGVDAHRGLGELGLFAEFECAREYEPRCRLAADPLREGALALAIKTRIETTRAARHRTRSNEAGIGASQQADRHVVPYVARRLHPGGFAVQPASH